MDCAWKLGNKGQSGQFIQSRATVIKLLDINGDGLADLVVRHKDGKMYSYRNTGTEFQIDKGLITGFDINDRPIKGRPINGNTALEEVKTDMDKFIAGKVMEGDRGFLRRMVDLDGDGLLDMVWFEGRNRIISTVSVKAKFNLGGRFGNEVRLLFPEKWEKAKNLFTVGLNTEFTGSWSTAMVWQIWRCGIKPPWPIRQAYFCRRVYFLMASSRPMSVVRACLRLLIY